MGMCYNYLQELSRNKEDDGESSGKKKPKQNKFRNDPLFQVVLRELEAQRTITRGFPTHPKMERLKALVVQHFVEKGDDGDGPLDNVETRAMVFVTHREAVDEIVEALNFEKPLIRATKFIGQGTDKRGEKGLAQKEQLEVCSLLSQTGFS